MEGIRPLTPARLERAVITIGRAFERDPMFAWIFPDPGERSRRLAALMRVPLRYGLRFGHATESNDATAVAVWIPPGRALTTGGMARCGMLAVPFRIGFRAFAAFMRANDVMGAFHQQHAQEPHWYLLVVGVDPDCQGRGLGTALIQEGLGRADQTGSPCYLETSDERNVRLYERFGFNVVGTALLGKDGPPGWAMRREPRRPADAASGRRDGAR